MCFGALRACFEFAETATCFIATAVSAPLQLLPLFQSSPTGSGIVTAVPVKALLDTTQSMPPSP